MLLYISQKILSGAPWHMREGRRHSGKTFYVRITCGGKGGKNGFGGFQKVSGSLSTENNWTPTEAHPPWILGSFQPLVTHPNSYHPPS